MVIKVNLYIYDLSKGMARQLSQPLLGKQIDGVWHTAIVCFGKEYFYGSNGITSCTPGMTILGSPDETVCVGETLINKSIFRDYLSGLSKEAFTAENYHLFHYNCNTFTNEVSQFLTGKKIPSYIIDLPQEVMSTPFGAMISQFLENVQVHPQTANDGVERRFSNQDDGDLFEHLHDGNSPREEMGNMSQSNSFDSSSDNQELLPAVFKVSDEDLKDSMVHLKTVFEESRSHLEKLESILEEVEFDFTDEDVVRKAITENLSMICTKLQGSSNGNVKSFQSLLIVLKATALNLSKIFKYAEGDEIILNVINKLQRGNIENVKEIKLLRIQFLTNLLSVYELRNHILAIESMIRTLVNLTVSSILDGPGKHIREAGCCLAYSLSIVKLNEDHSFELSSALLHIISDLEENTKNREFCTSALKNFMRKSDQVAELARMIVPELCEADLQLS